MTIPKSISVSDSIHFKSIDTGQNSAGDGGNGIFKGYVVNSPTLTFDPTNKATGADVSVTTGDSIHQKASWDAGTATANAHHGSTATASANSHGDQSSSSGYDTSTVHANTMATQTNSLTADQYQQVMAGMGGNGGGDNAAMGGNVDFHFHSSI